MFLRCAVFLYLTAEYFELSLSHGWLENLESWSPSILKLPRLRDADSGIKTPCQASTEQDKPLLRFSQIPICSFLICVLQDISRRQNIPPAASVGFKSCRSQKTYFDGILAGHGRIILTNCKQHSSRPKGEASGSLSFRQKKFFLGGGGSEEKLDPSPQTNPGGLEYVQWPHTTSGRTGNIQKQSIIQGEHFVIGLSVLGSLLSTIS